ncbi:MAG: SDR family oxidoreductase [Betaproteobacteria bacterium]|nr:SDR family oxidoreductase [Betaproteobacteria bacterium]
MVIRADDGLIDRTTDSRTDAVESDRPSPGSLRPVALVTGGARRLGREIALGLARQGWDVAVHYRTSALEARDTVAELQALGVRAAGFEADLAQEAHCDALLDAVIDALGLPLCLVNNASLFEYDGPASVSAGNLARHVGPNLAAPLRLSARLYQALPASARGVVVHLLDQKLAALNPDFFSYTLTKAALAAALPMQAIAFAPRLRVVGISPGLTLPSHLQTEEQFSRTHRETALLDHSSRPEDIVAAILALVANPAITGQNLVVDGGQHLLRMARDVSLMV